MPCFFKLKFILQIVFCRCLYEVEEVFPLFFFCLCVNFTRWCSIAWNRVLIRLEVRQYISWCITLPKIRNHCDVTTPSSDWSKLPLPVDGVAVRAGVKFGLVSNYVSYHDCFQKLLFNTDAVQNRQKGNDRQCDDPGIHLRCWSLSSAFSVKTRAVTLTAFRFSVWWFGNLHSNSCSFKCLTNALWHEFYESEPKPQCLRFHGKWLIQV